MARLIRIGAVIAFAAIGCGPNAATPTGEPCNVGNDQCKAGAYWVCDDGILVEAEVCDGNETCESGVGCTSDCTPGTEVCVGNSVHRCSSSGVIGETIETCPDGCFNGSCDQEGVCGNSGAGEFVFVVDNNNGLYAFDPAGDAHTFTAIGNLNCPAGPQLGGGGIPLPANPFSMSVDRNAVAWVLYNSGELFMVSTEDASCQTTAFQKQQQGYDMFGMGFSSADSSGAEERLYLAGSAIDPITGALANPKMGYLDPSTLQISHLGNMPVLENPPELTGTGDAKLYGYFPGTASVIAEIDKTTGQKIAGREWAAGNIAPSDTLLAWAFAHWGGRFYVFVTTGGIVGTPTSKVIRVDPDANGGAGEAVVVTQSGVPMVVGAGVSTCAPIVIE